MLFHVNDILVYSKDSAGHESSLQAALKIIQSAGIALSEGTVNAAFTSLAYLS